MITEKDKDEFTKAFFAYNGYPVVILDINATELTLYSECGGFQTIHKSSLAPMAEILWQLYGDRVVKGLENNYDQNQLEKILRNLVTVDISRVLTS